jgi:hypothetical protein
MVTGTLVDFIDELQHIDNLATLVFFLSTKECDDSTITTTATSKIMI